MLALGVGNAWGADVTETIKMIGFAGSTATSYVNVTQTGTSDKGTTMVAYAFNPKTGQVRGNKTAVAGASVASEDKNKNWSLYNSQAMGGAIKSITITQTAIGENKFQNEMYVSLGTTTQGAVTAITNAQKHTSLNANTITFDIDPSKGYTYFKLLSTKKFGTGTLAGVEVKVTYETASGGGETPVASLSATPTTIDFGTVYQGADVESKTVAVNFENLTGNVTYSGLSTPFTATGTVSNDGDKITIAANTATINEYSQTLTITSAADSKTAEVTVKMNVVEKPAPTGTFTLHTGELIEGDYVIVDGTNAMNNTVTSDRLQYNSVTITNDEIVDPLAATIWHIAPNGEYWTVYSADVDKYAASTDKKNQATLAASVSDNTKWTITKYDNTFDFENLARSEGSDSGNKYLRKNSTYGFACYASGTGTKLSLYRKAGTKYNVTVNSTTNGTVTADPTSAEAGTTITLTVTPDGGYVLDALTVTDANSNSVTVTDNTFTMPAADVTISATFKENEKPAATLTLSKNGVEETFPGSWKQDDVVTLPSITSDCVKAFVGWSANDECAIEPEYKAGDEYTLESTTQTLYAVYATVGAGETLTITPSAVSGSEDPYTFTINATGYSLTAKKNSGSTAPTYTSNEVRVYAKGTVTLTAPKAMGTIVFNISTNGKKRLAPITASVGTIATQASGDATVTWTGDATEVTFTVGDNAEFGSENTKAGQLCFGTIKVTTAGSYSNYSTTCAAAPIATVTPTSVTTTASSAEGKVTVTYENVNTANVVVALYNDEACTETFTAGWLTASIDADKNVTYTVAENTTYALRKAYIKLTAPETTGATDPDVVVIPVTQAAKEKVFASLAELVAADLTAGDEVTVTLNNDIIKEFYIYSSKRCGVVFDVQKDGKDIKIYFNSQTTIDDWAVGGKLSGTLTNVKWTTYSSAWQLAPANTWAWANLTYTETKAVSTVVVSGAPTKTTYVDGEAFDPAGLTITVNYNDATSEVNPTGVTFAVTPATLVKGQTSVSVTATYNSVTSAAYEVTGLTVNDIPTKTVAEFIAAGGTRCYLEGIVSGLTEGNSMKYGNFDLTDASGKIYVYGCLNAAGEEQKFADLGVKNGDKIKVIADEYELYGGTKEEAKNVQYVSHISAATITIADITMEVDETKTITATVVPAEAEVTYTIKENEANAISLSGNTITALAEGTATITATVAEGATYLGNSVDFTVTVNPQNIATLPFAFDGGVNDIKNTLGMSQKNLGKDYDNSPKLRFDDKDDYVIIHFDERPGKLTYVIKANTGSGAFSGEFAVQESADGVTYRDLVKYSTISGSKETKTHNCFDKDTRYIKFILATKDNGNVALGNIKIEKSVVTKVTPTIVENSYFSVGNNKYVQFSTGNLQYEVGTNTWSFASKQYEVIGGAAYDPANPTNTNYGMNEPGYTGKLDLFGWSSDGKFGVNPSNTDADYGTDGVNEFVDWGELVNETGWSTLTQNEMNYILNRKKDGKKLWALATVNDLVGLILLPDNWDTNINLVYGYIPEKFVYTKNLLSIAEWQTLEEAGAVFLPAGGSRTGGYGNTDKAGGMGTIDANGHYFHVDNVNIYGYYWLNTQDPRETHKNCASFLILPGWDEGPTVDEEGLDDLSTRPQVWSREKRRGNSVRLVKAIEPTYTREDQTSGAYGTVCYPENIVWCDGATLYEVAGKEGNKVIFDEVTTPKAGMPYIFIADQKDIYFFCGTEYEGTARKHNSLQGTFTEIAPAVDNILVDNYMLVNNIIKMCGINCGLKENRAYFIATELEDLEAPQSQMPSRRRISLDVTSENTTTGLDNITNGENTTIKVIENGQLIIIRNGEKFNAQGVRF